MTTTHECHLGVPTDEEPDGAPMLAWCTADGCGWTWTRPDGDRWADTLTLAWRAHRAAAEVRR